MSFLTIPYISRVQPGGMKDIMGAITIKLAYELYFYGIKRAADSDFLDFFVPKMPLFERKIFIDNLLLAWICFLFIKNLYDPRYIEKGKVKIEKKNLKKIEKILTSNPKG